MTELEAVQYFGMAMFSVFGAVIVACIIAAILDGLDNFKIWRGRNDVTYENLTRHRKRAIVGTHSTGPK